MPHNHWQQPQYWQHHHFRRYNMFCGPSRLVWFAFGSVATWAWIRHHHHHHEHHGAGGAACPPRVGYGGYNPQAGRPEWEQRDQSAAPANNASSSSSSSSPRRGDYGQWRPAQQPQPPTQAGQVPQSESMTPMDRDHERLRQIGRSAEETISGMSEATVDSMMGALQRLKERLAERRVQQQLQEIGPQQANPTLATTSAEEPSGPRHQI